MTVLLYTEDRVEIKLPVETCVYNVSLRFLIIVGR